VPFPSRLSVDERRSRVRSSRLRAAAPRLLFFIIPLHRLQVVQFRKAAGFSANTVPSPNSGVSYFQLSSDFFPSALPHFVLTPAMEWLSI